MIRQPYRDGKVHVCAAMCQSCIFRPGNLMMLRRGRVASMIRKAQQNESAIICHSTLGGDRAVCRGFFDRHETQSLQVAERLGMIEFQEIA